VSVALKAGAASAALVDITPLDAPPWQPLHDRLSALGISTYRCIRADLNDLLTIPALPEFDVVYCSGVLYHSPNPQVLMAALARLTRQVLILGTAVVPPLLSKGRRRLATTPGEARFVPELDDAQKAIVDGYFREVGAGEMVGLNAPTSWQPDDYSAWWWLFTREYIEALLRVSGFEIVDTGHAWGGRTALFLATKRERQ
jgi:SAM-dependent methyltransferase